MKRLLCGLMALGVLVGGAERANAQPNCAYTLLDVPGSFDTEAFGINNAGQIVGQYGNVHGFVLSGSAYSTVNHPGPLGYTIGTVLRSINDSGQIVGWDFINQPAFIRSADDAFLLSNGRYSPIRPDQVGQSVYYVYPYGVNNAGVIVGHYTYGDHPVSGLAFFGSGGNYSALDVPGSVRGSTGAFAINNAGQILVSSSLGYGLYQPLGGTYTTLKGLAPGLFYSLNGLNDADQVVGEYSDAANTYHGFVLSDGVLTNLDVPGAKNIAAFGINDAGEIVGTYEAADGCCSPSARLA
jgi:uncharacterized membrane protein